MRQAVMLVTALTILVVASKQLRADGGGTNGGMTLPPSTSEKLSRTEGVEAVSGDSLGAPWRLVAVPIDRILRPWSQSGCLIFTGRLQGNFSVGNANITNLFDCPTYQTLTLGNNVYDVRIGPYGPPPPVEYPLR
jgi:hypothetical protein